MEVLLAMPNTLNFTALHNLGRVDLLACAQAINKRFACPLNKDKYGKFLNDMSKAELTAAIQEWERCQAQQPEPVTWTHHTLGVNCKTSRALWRDRHVDWCLYIGIDHHDDAHAVLRWLLRFQFAAFGCERPAKHCSAPRELKLWMPSPTLLEFCEATGGVLRDLNDCCQLHEEGYRFDGGYATSDTLPAPLAEAAIAAIEADIDRF